MKTQHLPAGMLELVKVAGFSNREIMGLDSFLEPFCPNARLCLTWLFIRGKTQKQRTKPLGFGEILSVCQNIWAKFWQHGTPGRIGDMNDTAIIVGSDCDGLPNSHGSRNTGCFEHAYKMLGIPLPRSFP